MATERLPFGHEATGVVIGAFYDVYNHLGYGFLESVYTPALRYELESRGLYVDREVWVDIFYKVVPIAKQRIDLVVNHSIIVEIKASEKVPPFSRRQLLNYLRASQLELGLLLHFGPKPKIYRLVDTMKSRAR
jgi:GxxExxY protein